MKIDIDAFSYSIFKDKYNRENILINKKEIFQELVLNSIFLNINKLINVGIKLFKQN